MNYHLYNYQQMVADFALDLFFVRDEPGAGLFLDPGLGKTLITLHLLNEWRTYTGYCKALIVAPLRVCHAVWPKEVRKWGFDFKVNVVHGTKPQRIAQLETKADLYVINPEGLNWMMTSRLKLPAFDFLVVDESTKFKNWSSQRTKRIRQLLEARPQMKRLILTGTPTPNTMLELFPQLFIVDSGKTLGEKITPFRKRYAKTVGNVRHGRYEIVEHRKKELADKVAKVCISMDAESNLDMPDKVINEIRVDLPRPIHMAYKEIERKLWAQLENGEELVATDAAARYNLCRQISNGGAYQKDEFGNRKPIHVHDAKVHALVDLYEELNGKQLLVAYQFQHDLERIRSKFPNCKAINGKTKTKEFKAILEAWRNHDVGLLAVQCQAMSHGVDGLQDACSDVCWFGMSDMPEIHDQLNARIYRNGQESKHIRLHYILANDTIDFPIRDRLADKSEGQQALLTKLRAYAEGQEVSC